MNTIHTLSRHARQRSQQRQIPHGIIELILDYGTACDGRWGGRKYSLTKESLRSVRRHFGCQFSDALAQYRRAHVISSSNAVITAYFS